MGSIRTMSPSPVAKLSLAVGSGRANRIGEGVSPLHPTLYPENSDRCVESARHFEEFRLKREPCKN